MQLLKRKSLRTFRNKIFEFVENTRKSTENQFFSIKNEKIFENIREKYSVNP